MSMTPAIIGALVGFAIAVLDNLLVTFIASRPNAKGNVAMLRILVLPTLIIFPIIGYFVAPMVVH